MNKPEPRYAVVIPALNAERWIGAVVQSVRRVAPPHTVIYVVDDGSSDATGVKAVDAGAVLLTHNRNRGKGTALQSGYTAAFEQSIEWAISMDADGQHLAEDLPDFVQAMQTSRWDLLLGNRMTSRGDMPWPRVLSNTLTSWLVSLRLAQPVHDAQCGFRGMRRDVFEAISVRQTGFMAESEWLLRSGIAGARIGHVSVQSVYGTSRSHITPIRDTLRFIGLYCRCWFWI
jgi:glycosyltransferase involved in cell wall biosynthesis